MTAVAQRTAIRDIEREPLIAAMWDAMVNASGEAYSVLLEAQGAEW
jgi:hypothetical protein